MPAGIETVIEVVPGGAAPASAYRVVLRCLRGAARGRLGAADRVLVVQGELDPQTGYEQARAAVRAAPGVSLVSVDDSPFHGQYAFEGNPCVDGMVNVFLLRNSRPGTVTCPGVPLLDETEVHPVPGPVRTPAPAPAVASAAAPLPELRASVQAMLSESNAPLR